MVVLGIDHGTKRIGVAVGATEVKVAHPVETVAAERWQTALRQLIADHSAEHLVIGLPRGLDGQETAQTALAREFATQIESEFGLPVTLQDEAGTSELAQQRLAGSKATTKKGDVDAMAAAIILQDYLGGLDV